MFIQKHGWFSDGFTCSRAFRMLVFVSPSRHCSASSVFPKLDDLPGDLRGHTVCLQLDDLLSNLRGCPALFSGVYPSCSFLSASVLISSHLLVAKLDAFGFRPPCACLDYGPQTRTTTSRHLCGNSIFYGHAVSSCRTTRRVFCRYSIREDSSGAFSPASRGPISDPRRTAVLEKFQM